MCNHSVALFFLVFFRERNLLQGKFLAAVSGGIDSSVLCELCKHAGLKLSIAHCNFGLRGEESERDENFVRSLGEKYSVEVFVKKFETEKYANEKKISIQEAARELRYDWFVELKKQHDFSFTLLAHHADDNIETLLMNFFRGTGLQGLTAMPDENRDEKFFLRPLLHIRRKEIVEFAEQNNLQWVVDSSNASSKYTRNFFRNELLPAIKKVYEKSMDEWYAVNKKAECPLFDFMYAYARHKKINPENDIRFLTDTPLDLIDWHIDHTKREDIKLVRYPTMEDIQVDQLPPASMRSTVRWDKNPWLAESGDPHVEREPVFWLLPYWMGRYLKIIE